MNIRYSGWVISVRFNDICLLLVSDYNSVCVGLWKRMQASIPVLYICYIVLLVIVLCLLLSNDIELNPGPICKALNICHVNIRSLSQSKLTAIQCSLSDAFDLITISETHLHAGLPNDLFELKGFHRIIRRDRVGLGGGVAVYVKENIKYQRIVAFERPGLEAIWLQINTIEGKILVGCIYRPPDKVDGPSGVQFWDNLGQVLDDIKVSKYKYIYLLGDMNADFNTVNGQRLR